MLSLGLLLVGGAWFLFGADNRTVPAPVQDPLGTSSTSVTSAAAVPPAPGQAAAPVPADPPAPVATNQPAVAAETASSAASREAEIAAAVEAWRSAWAARDMGKYLDAYSRAFVPEGGVSRQDWVANRYRNVGGRPSIDVVIRNVQIESLAQNSVRVSFLQD